MPNAKSKRKRLGPLSKVAQHLWQLKSDVLALAGIEIERTGKVRDATPTAEWYWERREHYRRARESVLGIAELLESYVARPREFEVELLSLFGAAEAEMRSRAASYADAHEARRVDFGGDLLRLERALRSAIEAKAARKPKKRGPKHRFVARADEQLVAAWEAARRQRKLTRSEFERERGLEPGDVRRAYHRVKARKQVRRRPERRTRSSAPS